MESTYIYMLVSRTSCRKKLKTHLKTKWGNIYQRNQCHTTPLLSQAAPPWTQLPSLSHSNRVSSSLKLTSQQNSYNLMSNKFFPSTLEWVVLALCRGFIISGILWHSRGWSTTQPPTFILSLSIS